MRPPSPSVHAGARETVKKAGQVAASATGGSERASEGLQGGGSDADSGVSYATVVPALLLPTVVGEIECSGDEFDDYDSADDASPSGRRRQSHTGSESAAGSDTEAKRWHRRKELNRLAAQKCRRRRKEKALHAQMEISRLQTTNNELKWKVGELLRTKLRLCELVQSHFGTSVDELIRTVSQ